LSDHAAALAAGDPERKATLLLAAFGMDEAEVGVVLTLVVVPRILHLCRDLPRAEALTMDELMRLESMYRAVAVPSMLTLMGSGATEEKFFETISNILATLPDPGVLLVEYRDDDMRLEAWLLPTSPIKLRAAMARLEGVPLDGRA
jgi:hypothetical protein